MYYNIVPFQIKINCSR